MARLSTDDCEVFEFTTPLAHRRVRWRPAAALGGDRRGAEAPLRAFRPQFHSASLLPVMMAMDVLQRAGDAAFGPPSLWKAQ